MLVLWWRAATGNHQIRSDAERAFDEADERACGARRLPSRRAGPLGGEELGRAADDEVGSLSVQSFGPTGAADADDKAEAGCARRRGTGWISGFALRQADSAAREECAYAFEPRLAVDVPRPVDTGLNGANRPFVRSTRLEMNSSKVSVQASRVNRGASDQHAVEVEDACVHALRKLKQLSCIPRRQRQWRELVARALILRERLQEHGGQATLGLEQGSSIAKLVRRQIGARTTKRDEGGVERRTPACPERVGANARRVGLLADRLGRSRLASARDCAAQRAWTPAAVRRAWLEAGRGRTGG
jgi:hypothetical protein